MNGLAATLNLASVQTILHSKTDGHGQWHTLGWQGHWQGGSDSRIGCLTQDPVVTGYL
jgi:hypothetical protein